MQTADRRAWIPIALLVGAVYLGIGMLFSLPATNVIAWRRAAWIASAVVFAAQLAFERYRLRTAPRAAALHAASSVALGALGLAVRAMIHAVTANLPIRTNYVLSLVLWPLLTGIPAFVVALVIATALGRRTSSISHPLR